MRYAIGLCIALVSSMRAPAAETQSPESSGMESLGQKLLDDLTPKIPRQWPKPSPDPAAPATQFDDLGEDIGQPSGPLSLTRVHHGMQQAEALLAQQQLAGRTDNLQQAEATQQEVVDQLDKLIAELSKQCQGGQCKPGDQPPKPSQSSQTKPGKSASSAASGQTAARDSNAQLNQASAQPMDKDKQDIDTLVKQLWGHLPERSRQQMLQSFSDEFLPRYELEIEQYYRRLSEENEENRPQ